MRRLAISIALLLMLPLMGHGQGYNIPFSPQAVAGSGYIDTVVSCWLMDGTNQAAAENNACDTDDGTWTGTWANRTDPDGGSNAADYDGSTDTMSVPHDAKYITNDFTIGCWAYRELGSTGYMFSKSTDAYALQGLNSDRVRNHYSGNNSPSTGLFVDDAWTHVVMRHVDDVNGYIEAFLNGKPACSGACTSNTGNASGAAAMTIGSLSWDGGLYECWMADVAFTDLEICEICRFGLDGQAADRGTACGSPACTYQ